MDTKLPKLPISSEPLLESMPVLKALASAHRYLAELKGVAQTIPNEEILICSGQVILASDLEFSQ